MPTLSEDCKAMITTLSGPNEFARSSALEQLVSQFINEYGAIGLEQLEADEIEFQQIYDSLTSLPFLSSKKLIVLKQGMANKQFIEHTEELLQNLAETTDLVLYEPKLDKRSSYFKLLKKITNYQEFRELDEAGLVLWLVNTAKSEGGSLSAHDARYLVQRLGLNQQLLANEITKLLLYSPNITTASINLLTDQTPQSTIFNLLDAAFAGDIQQAFLLYREQRAQRVEPPQIIAMITWQLYVLALLKTAGQRPVETIAQETKLNPFVIRKSMNVARKLSLTELKQLVRVLSDIDVSSKTTAIDPDEALQNYLIAVSRLTTSS